MFFLIMSWRCALTLMHYGSLGELKLNGKSIEPGGTEDHFKGMQISTRHISHFCRALKAV